VRVCDRGRSDSQGPHPDRDSAEGLVEPVTHALVTGPLHPLAPPGSARRSPLVTYLAVGYTLLIVYASLYSLYGWSNPPESVFRLILAPWPRYYTIIDLALNVIGYVPLGFLVALMVLGFSSSRIAAVTGTLSGVALSLVMALRALSEFQRRNPPRIDAVAVRGSRLRDLADVQPAQFRSKMRFDRT
jgi:VanZ family protein